VWECLLFVKLGLRVEQAGFVRFVYGKDTVFMRTSLFPTFAEVVVLVHINVLAILTTFVGHLNLLNLLTIFADVINLICFTQGNFNPCCNLHWE
jgi:hypothetical protein